MYVAVDAMIPQLVKGDYEVDEKSRNVTLTESGNEHMVRVAARARVCLRPAIFTTSRTSRIVHHVNQALKAHTIFQKDRDYIVKGDKVVIIDEFTGRMMEGRRYSEGLHQALEAKEKVEVQPENVTLASITFQNYFRLYDKLAGMTGTALTEAAEFMDIYKLDVMEVPTNVPVKRIDADDEVYRTAEEKNEAIIKLVEECRKKGQPVLVGTTSIEKSELLSRADEEAQDSAQRAERALPRAGSGNRRAGRRARRRHDRDQHGRPRHRHSARRQRRHAHSRRTRRCAGRQRTCAPLRRDPRRNPRRQGKGSMPRAVSTSSAPNGTKAAASTISFAAVPAVRAIPVPRNSS